MIFNISQFWITKNYHEIFWCLNEIIYWYTMNWFSLFVTDVDQVSLSGCGIKWTGTDTTLKSSVAVDGTNFLPGPDVSSNLLALHRGSCPSQSCPRTVTLCNQCVNYDVPGNIHYGWVDRAATICRWLLLYAAERVQKGGIDDPKDQNAITIGMNMWDDQRKRSRNQMCKEVAHKIHSLNRQGTSGCRSCSTRY